VRLASWNVNSLRVRLPHLVDWLAAAQPDVACLQETKTEDANFPVAELRAAGYHAVYCGQRAYNGVAILSRSPIADVTHGIPDFPDDPKRCIAATVGSVRIVCLYAPNGEAPGTEKYAYKLRWYDALARWMKALVHRTPELALLGDMNVAPEDRDVHDPQLWRGRILFSAPEKKALNEVKDWGFVDAYREHVAAGGNYSWWDYRAAGFRRNAGLRIDHIWVSPPLAERCTKAWIDKEPRGWERPSDHTPVVAEFR
jgi:exodeoxyribonuclease III